MTRLRCLIENQSITLNAYYMTGGQAKGNRHLTPLMLAYILEMSTYYNESLFMFIVNVHHVLYCNVLYCNVVMRWKGVMYTTLMRELELESNDFNFSFQCMMTLFFLCLLPTIPNKIRTLRFKVTKLFSITSSTIWIHHNNAFSFSLSAKKALNNSLNHFLLV